MRTCVTHAFLLILIAAASAHAESVVVSFTGTLNGNPTLFGNPYTAGTTIEGTYTYDDATANADPDADGNADYVGAITDIDLMIGGDTYDLSDFGSLTANNILLRNNFNLFDTYQVLISGTLGYFRITLRDSQQDALSSDLLTDVPANLFDPFGQAGDTKVNRVGTDGGSSNWSLSTHAVVPEPSTMLLALVGSASLLVRRRKRSA